MGLWQKAMLSKMLKEPQDTRILVAGVQVPFTVGGAEILVSRLIEELRQRNYKVDLVQLPFNASAADEVLAEIVRWQSLDLSELSGREVDLVICTKFPSYLLSHPRKSIWLVHQYRQFYDLYGSGFGASATSFKDEVLRQIVVRSDLASLVSSSVLCTISQNVSNRLKRYLDLDSSVIMPPLPLANRYFSGEKGNYILSVGRLCHIKRVDLLIKALPRIASDVTLKIVGVSDEPEIDKYLKNEIDKHHLWDRVQFLGRVEDEELLNLYSNAFAVYYAPFDEDYGFVTLEALASGKPVVTAFDSGGTLEFILNEQNGFVVTPDPNALATAFNKLWRDSELYLKMQSNIANMRKETDGPTNWDQVISSLLAPLFVEEAMSN